MRAVPRRVVRVGAVAVALLLAVVVAAAAVLAVRVQGGSMQPTLGNGDRVLLHPFTGGDLPHRFALVVGRFEAGGPRVVKRVIGLPGDRVRIGRDDDGVVQVEVATERDGVWQQVDNPAWGARTWAEGAGCCTEEGRATASEAQLVPAGMLFLLGDDPAVSRDSLSFGWAPAELVDGVVGLRIWPLRGLGRVGGRVHLRPGLAIS